MPRKPTKEEILDKAFLSEVDLERLGIRKRKTSQNLRSTGREILPYTRFGRSVRYIAEDVWAYLEKKQFLEE